MEALVRNIDFDWLIEHAREIDEQYAGKWIAVSEGRLVGVGDTATEAAQEARQAASGKRFVLEAIDAEEEVIHGGVSGAE